MTILWIGLGGALGAVCRYGFVYVIGGATLGWVIIVNAVGSFVLGALFRHIESFWWVFLGIGFFGAFTTFSTYALDVLKLLMAQQWGVVTLYIVASNSLSVLMCWLGFQLSSKLSFL